MDRLITELGRNLVTIVTFLPLVALAVILFIPQSKRRLIFGVAMAGVLLDFLLSIPFMVAFLFPDQPVGARVLFEVLAPWIPNLGINYHVGIDGISLYLVMLTTFLGPLVVLWSYRDITDRFKEFMAMLLILQTAMLGVFVARDLVLFYIFFEAMLIPMYFVIGIWGGKNRIYATYKFVLYTMVGSVLMLAAIFYLYSLSHTIVGGPTTDYDVLLGSLTLTKGEQILLFLAFGLAFAIKVPLFPFHTWLPDAHTEAPTAGSVILAGVLLKVGTYGFLRFALPLFPYATLKLAPTIMVLAVIGITYGAMVAAVQEDFKRLVAFSSVAHLGFVMLGMLALTPEAMVGSLLQQINHGISTGGLFFLVGMLYWRRHTRQFKDFGGLMAVMPLYAVLFLWIMLSSVGLPGLNGFVGEFLILLGSFKVWPAITVVATAGVILAAVYLLWMYRRLFHGEVTNPENLKLKDLDQLEVAVLLPIILVALWIGLYPTPFTRPMEAPLRAIAERVELARPLIEEEKASPSEGLGEGVQAAFRRLLWGAAEAAENAGNQPSREVASR